jgi:hypothetical protein
MNSKSVHDKILMGRVKVKWELREKFSSGLGCDFDRFMAIGGLFVPMGLFFRQKVLDVYLLGL